MENTTLDTSLYAQTSTVTYHRNSIPLPRPLKYPSQHPGISRDRAILQFLTALFTTGGPIKGCSGLTKSSANCSTRGSVFIIRGKEEDGDSVRKREKVMDGF